MAVGLLSAEEQMTRIEKSLMLGRGRFIADFTESFRNYRVDNVIFDAFLHGNTRMKGFLLSRLFSATINPNYYVACFMISIADNKGFDKKFLSELLHAVRARMKEDEMRWAWLFIFAAKGANAPRKMIEGLKDQFIGVAMVDVNSGNIVHSDSYIGKQAKRFIRI